MKSIAYILTLFILTLIQVNCFSQNSDIVRIGPNYSGSNEISKYFIILDGVPIFKTKETFNYIDTTSVDSIIIHKQIVYNSKGKQVYNAFIEIRSIESVHNGLKYIQHETNNIIFKYPLAKLSINGKVIKWNKIFRKMQLISNPNFIEKVEFVEPNNRKNKYGLIKLTIKK